MMEIKKYKNYELEITGYHSKMEYGEIDKMGQKDICVNKTAQGIEIYELIKNILNEQKLNSITLLENEILIDYFDISGNESADISIKIKE